MKKIALIIMASMVSLSASATINTDNTWGCITLSKNNELNKAIKSKDNLAINYLLSYSCVVLHRGQHVTIVDESKSEIGLFKVRVYPKNKRPKEIWVETYYINKNEK